MDWSQWPQWTILFWAVYRVVLPVMIRAGGFNNKPLVTWTGEYLANILGVLFIIVALYYGDFWNA